MNPQDAIDLGREAVRACFMVGGPILIASLIIGLLVGVVQAMTQVQDQTVSFVPKLLCLLVVLGLCLPWLTDQMVSYSKETLSQPMTHFHQTGPVSQVGFLRTAERSLFDEKQTDPPAEQKESQLDESNEQLKSPFILPHYRFSRRPKENLDG